jgi:hypothetical protein
MTTAVFRTTLRFGCALACVTGAACAPEAADPSDPARGHKQAIVDVPQSAVERQEIGNCWVYAGSGWAESLHRTADGTSTLDISESYWTYMHWFVQLTSPTGGQSTEISTGGHFRMLQRIVTTYGLMNELDFIPADSDDERAFSQSRALARINAALAAGGALATPEDRANPAKVRQVLDEAWRLSDAVRAELSTAFGADLSRTFQAGATVEGTTIMRASDVAVGYGGRMDRTLESAFAEWREISVSPYRKRDTLRRVQRALHAREPVIMSWLVDFNAFEEDKEHPLYGSFNLQTLAAKGAPGSQGGHMTVLEDYQARLHGQVYNTLSEVSLQADLTQGAFQAITVADAPSVRIEAGQVLRVAITGSGDADLYVQTGTAPSVKSYACRPYSAGSEESCVVDGPAEVFVGLGAYRDSSVKLTISTELVTESDQVLAAGVTLDPANSADAALLQAALDDSTEIEFFRVKNSWGANRRGLAMVQGFEKGYHDIHFDYLNGPVTDREACERDGGDLASCSRQTVPLRLFIVPPGY